MGKDPAVLFYTSDFLTGTSLFNNEQKGQYITLLCQQHQLGGLPENHMINVCGSLDSIILTKFVKNGDGLYYNERMKLEGEKRRNYCKSRSNDKSGRPKIKKNGVIIRKSYDNHMEDENEDRDKDKNLKEIFDEFRKVYPGRKRGLDVEFDNLKKCCKKYKLKISDIIPLLESAIETTKKNNNIKLKRNLFVAEWKHLETWINKQCWTEEEIIEDEENLY